MDISSQGTPIPDFQRFTCDQLLLEQGADSANIRNAVATCLDVAASAAAPNGKTKGATMANPARMVRLVRAVIEGGNEPVANRLGQSMSLTIDSTCSAIVSHLEACRKALGGKKGYELGDAGRWAPASVLKLLSEPDSVGGSTLGLLVEQVFVLPLNAQQMRSPHLWNFLSYAAGPCIEVSYCPPQILTAFFTFYFLMYISFVVICQSIAQQESLNANQSVACVDLLDLLERVYFTLMRLGLYQAATEDATKVLSLLRHPL